MASNMALVQRKLRAFMGHGNVAHSHERFAVNPAEAVQDPIEEFAARVREAYVSRRRALVSTLEGVPSTYGMQRMPKWDGGEDSSGRRHTSIWVRIALMLLEANCFDAEGYVNFVMEGGVLVEPNWLLSRQRLRNYMINLVGTKSQRQREYAAELEQFVAAVNTTRCWFPDKTDQELWEHVLLSQPRWHLSALFCYATALSFGARYIADIYEDLALKQFMQDPNGYVTGWGEQLPEEIVQRAEAYRRSFNIRKNDG